MSFLFPFPKIGNGFFHFHSRSQKLGKLFFIPVPKILEWAEQFPFPFPKSKIHSRSPLMASLKSPLSDFCIVNTAAGVNQTPHFCLSPPFSLFQQIWLLDFPALISTSPLIYRKGPQIVLIGPQYLPNIKIFHMVHIRADFHACSIYDLLNK